MIEKFVIVFDDKTQYVHYNREASDRFLHNVRHGAWHMKPPKPIYRIRVMKKIKS